MRITHHQTVQLAFCFASKSVAPWWTHFGSRIALNGSADGWWALKMWRTVLCSLKQQNPWRMDRSASGLRKYRVNKVKCYFQKSRFCVICQLKVFFSLSLSAPPSPVSGLECSKRLVSDQLLGHSHKGPSFSSSFPPPFAFICFLSFSFCFLTVSTLCQSKK